MTGVPFSDWPIESSWTASLTALLADPKSVSIAQELARKRKETTVFPPDGKTFRAFALTPIESVRAVILGQDPYHGPNQAHGLSFSVEPPTPPPPSLKNIFREWSTDLDFAIPSNGNLSQWARSGVLLLNTVLTVEAGSANSHRNLGWEWFTDCVMQILNLRPNPIVFILWGAHAQQKEKWLTVKHHPVIKSAHPSPLSAYRGFFGSKPFSKANSLLSELGQQPIDWRLDP